MCTSMIEPLEAFKILFALYKHYVTSAILKAHAHFLDGRGNIAMGLCFY